MVVSFTFHRSITYRLHLQKKELKHGPALCNLSFILFNRPKALHRVQFKGSSASGSSPDFLSKKCSNLLSSGAFAPPKNHSKQVLQGTPPAQSSMNTSVLQSLLSERHKEGAHQQEELSLHIGELKKLPVPDNLIEVQDGKGLENARLHLDTSSSSASEGKVGEQ